MEIWALNPRRHTIDWHVLLFIPLLLLGLSSLACAADRSQNELSAGAIINPEGLFLGYSRALFSKEKFSLGLFDNLKVLTNEFGFYAQFRTEPEWLVSSLQIGVEPGLYLFAGQSTRKFDLRKFVRSKTEVTLEGNGLRFYSRTILLYRGRNFLEDDRFQGVLLDSELAIEQALAPMFLVERHNFDSLVCSYWGYVEYTVGAIRGAGTRPNRISGGVVAENWPFRAVTVNLDLFFSFLPEPHHGLGSILLLWWKW